MNGYNNMNNKRSLYRKFCGYLHFFFDTILYPRRYTYTDTLFSTAIDCCYSFSFCHILPFPHYPHH